MAKRFENHQMEVLKAAFGESENLTKEKKNELVAATGLAVEQIARWFSHRRARKRPREATEELELEYSALKQAIKPNRGDEAELKRELLGSKIGKPNYRMKTGV
ncbi:hypothetical protein CDL12_01735 [Handroanthus impetiginosus]|uniref:Homeobox-leucine zipper protein n=1 Tax=Handroanthus impetiginosus TaxID=429701 RepID=A0A2G9I723_9LAMI|nr:hypothetical protein CDL12_01735 [Handroanthus impetiginosus]